MNVFLCREEKKNVLRNSQWEGLLFMTDFVRKLNCKSIIYKTFLFIKCIL